MPYLPAILAGEIDADAKSFLQACSVGVGADTFIVNAADNSIDEASVTCLVMGGRSSDPNKIGFAGKPLRDDFTPTGWADDTDYPSGAAQVATIVGGYDHVCNQIAGLIVGGGHNFIKYNASGHSTIVGGSYNIISSGRAFIGAGRRNSITGDEFFGIIVGGDDNEVVDSSYGIAVGGLSNTVTNADWGAILNGQSNTVSAAYSTVINGNGCSISQGYSWVVGLDLTCDYFGSGVIGRNASAPAEYSLTIGGQQLAEKDDRKTYSIVLGRRTTNATSIGMEDNIPMPAGKIVAGVIRAHLVAMRDGSANANNDDDYSMSTYQLELGFFWNGTSGFFHDVSGETSLGAGPTRNMTVIRDNITLASAPQFRLSTGALRINVAGLAATTINWVARLDVTQTIIS